MQWKQGTVAVETDSNIVTGQGTLWLANVNVGDWFKINDRSPIYQIASVDSDTQIKLTVNYAQASGTGLVYCIARDFTPILSLPLIYRGDIDWPDFYNRGMILIEQAIISDFPKLDTDPDTSGWGNFEAGKIWFNKTDKKFKGWNGSEIVLLG